MSLPPKKKIYDIISRKLPPYSYFHKSPLQNSPFLPISPNPQKTVDKSFFRWYYRQAVAWDTGSNLRSNGDREAWKLYRCTILMERVCEARWKVCWEAESFLKKLFQKTSKNLLTKRKQHDIITKLSRKTAFHEREIFPIEESELIRQ